MTVSVVDKGPDAEVTLGALTAVGGDLKVESRGTGAFAAGPAAPGGDTTLTLDGYATMAATTAIGTTTVENARADAVMRAAIPSAAFVTPVAFSITRIEPALLPPESGAAAGARRGRETRRGIRVNFAGETEKRGDLRSTSTLGLTRCREPVARGLDPETADGQQGDAGGTYPIVLALPGGAVQNAGGGCCRAASRQRVRPRGSPRMSASACRALLDVPFRVTHSTWSRRRPSRRGEVEAAATPDHGRPWRSSASLHRLEPTALPGPDATRTQGELQITDAGVYWLPLPRLSRPARASPDGAAGA